MKNIKYSALVAIAAIAASCAKESTVIEKETIKDIPMEPMCIQTGDESETKTSLNGQTVNWTEGDQIAVYSNMDYSKGYKFFATNIKDINRNTATFSGEVPAGTESFFAVYPPERVSSASASGAVVNIPSDQTPAEGTFGEELNITIAKGTKIPGTPNVGTIHFRNVCSYVKFTVPAYVSDVNFVKISSENAIAGKLTVDYTGENPSSEIAADGAKSISMSGSFGKGKTFIFVIAPGTISNFQIDIKTASGKNWTRTIRTGFTATAGKPVNLRTVDFKIASMTATVNHTYEGEGETKTLTGTNLVIDNLNIPDGLTGYVQKVHIDIIPEGKTTAVRSADITDFSNQNSIAVNSKEYPYLPKGTYTIKSTYTMSDGTIRETSGSFSVSAPTFEITSQPTIYTSYSVYTSSTPINGIAAGAAGANGLDGSSIYVKKGTVSIDGNLLTKYSSIASYTYTDGTTALNEGQNGNMGWSEHTVSSSFTFDGVTRNFNNVTCHVTGLPYKNDFQSNFSGWYGNNTLKINSGGLEIPAKAGYAISPEFYVPANINITFTYDLYNNGAVSNTRKFYHGVVKNQKSSVNENDGKSTNAASWTAMSSTTYNFDKDNYHCIFFYAPNQTLYAVRVRNLVINYR